MTDESTQEDQSLMRMSDQAETTDPANLLSINRALKAEIRDRKLAEEALRTSEEQFRALVENVPGAVYRCEINAPWRVHHMSEGVQLLIGYPAHEFIEGNLNWADLVVPEDMSHVERAVEEGVENRRHFEIEYRIEDATGDIRWVHEKGRAIYDDKGEAIFLDGVIIDTTAAKLTEEALRESEARFRALFQEAGIGIAMINTQGHLEYSNTALQAMLGYSCEELAAKVFIEFTHPEDVDGDTGLYQELMEGKREAYSMEKRYIRKDGELIHANLTVTPICNAAGKPALGICIVENITGRKQAQGALNQLNAELERRVDERTAELQSTIQELEAFSYSIAHDLRSPLRSITSFSQILQESAADRLHLDEQGSLERVIRAGQHMAQLIDEILELSRISRVELTRDPVDLSALVHAAVKDFQHTHSEREVEWIIQEGVTVYGDVHLIPLLLQNLIDNAQKFSRDKEAPKIEFGIQRKGSESVYYIRDNGIGFDMQYANKLFKPFHRLHQTDEFPGTGIGLATVARIATRHGGKVWVKSTPDEGATFYFTLP